MIEIVDRLKAFKRVVTSLVEIGCDFDEIELDGPSTMDSLRISLKRDFGVIVPKLSLDGRGMTCCYGAREFHLGAQSDIDTIFRVLTDFVTKHSAVERELVRFGCEAAPIKFYRTVSKAPKQIGISYWFHDARSNTKSISIWVSRFARPTEVLVGGYLAGDVGDIHRLFLKITQPP